MIWQPKKYQSVRIHYRKSLQKFMPYHGKTGVVVCVGKGPGPKNVLIELDEGGRVCVPRGNLNAL